MKKQQEGIARSKYSRSESKSFFRSPKGDLSKAKQIRSELKSLTKQKLQQEKAFKWTKTDGGNYKTGEKIRQSQNPEKTF